MKVLLAQNMYFLPSRGGANKSNRLIVERLAARGHECHVVAPLTGRVRNVDLDELPSYLARLGATVVERTERVLVYRRAGVTVHAVFRGHELPRTAGEVIDDVGPDWALVPNDDPGMMMLSAVRRRTDRIVYVVHTLQQLPFGPRSFYPNEAATAMIRRCPGVVSVSRAAQDYVRRWSGMDSELIYPDVYADVRAPDARATGRRYVTLVNPCAYKGIQIFLALADALPDVPFLAVDGWGTTDKDRSDLAARPNIVTIPGVDDMDEVYRQTAVLLMPSLWDETFGYCSVEAMLRGIPVLAADIGGLREAKLGVEYLLPVAPIIGYTRDRSSVHPVPDAPAQETGPWLSALRRLLADSDLYERLSRDSRMASQRFVQGLDQDALETYMTRLGSTQP